MEREKQRTIKAEPLTTYIKHLAVSGLSGVSARIKSSCSLIGNRFEMPNVSYT
ncbi:MAG: hypothetical protein IAE98_01140 [Candidatus Kapabacteria bacterium]|jgi:hypothetical protein|nr:hypothetical protein [Candidatus Kapabacteria bacterium]